MKQPSALFTTLLLLFYFHSIHAEETPVLISDDINEVLDISSNIEFFLDPAGDWSLNEVIAQEFQSLKSDVIDFGFTTDKIWLHFKVINSSTNSLEKTLRSSARFMRPLEIYIVREDSAIEQLLYNDETHSFGERPIPQLRFLAAEFSMAPLEQAEFYIRFGAGGQASMLLQISSLEEAVLEQSTAAIGIAIYASILFTLTIVNFFHYLAVRKLAYLLYAFYESFNILYVSHIEGFTFQYFWPNLPQVNADATPVIAAAGLVIGNIFAMVFLEAKKYAPTIHKVFLSFIAVSVFILLVNLFVDNRIGNQLAAPFLPLSLIHSVVAAAIILHKGHYVARYFLFAWGIFFIGTIIWTGSILGLIDASYNVITVYKLTIAAQAIILSMGLADQVRRLNNQYINTQGELIESLQGRLEDAKERIQLEKRNDDATLQLLNKSKLLANTSHDIHQPIHSLRALLKSLSLKGSDSTVTSKLSETLDHMEAVLGNALNNASIDLKEVSKQSHTYVLSAEALVQQIVDSLAERALAKQLEVRGCKSNVILVAQELPLKRCLLNLVSNALENTTNGGVLLGVRRRGTRTVFQVYDTGQGIPQDGIDDLVSPFVKGEQSAGHGLGLAIVSEICSEYDWNLNIQSRLGRGSCFSISVPTRI